MQSESILSSSPPSGLTSPPDNQRRRSLPRKAQIHNQSVFAHSRISSSNVHPSYPALAQRPSGSPSHVTVQTPEPKHDLRRRSLLPRHLPGLPSNAPHRPLPLPRNQRQGRAAARGEDKTHHQIRPPSTYSSFNKIITSGASEKSNYHWNQKKKLKIKKKKCGVCICVYVWRASICLV